MITDMKMKGGRKRGGKKKELCGAKKGPQDRAQEQDQAGHGRERKPDHAHAPAFGEVRRKEVKGKYRSPADSRFQRTKAARDSREPSWGTAAARRGGHGS